MLFEIVLFVIVLISMIYLPGRFLVRVCGFSFPSQTIHLPISFSVGLSFFVFSTFLLSYLRLDILYLLFVIPVVVIEIKSVIKSWKKRKKRILPSFPLIATVCAGTVWMSYLMWGSGRIVGDELVFYAVNSVDAIWHLSLIGNLSHSFPPTHPGLSPLDLKGYNFLYDFLLSRFIMFFHFSHLDLFFRLFPPFLALLYGLSGFALAQFLRMKKLATHIFIYLLYFGFGVEELLSGIFSIDLDTGIVHSSANAVDPSVILSITLVFCIFILFFSAKSKRQMVLPAVMLGILPMIKIYTAILAFASFGLISLKYFFSKEYKGIVFILCAGFIAGFFYLPTNLGAGSLVFAPFLIFRHFMEDGKIFPEMQWALKLATYQEDHNILRIIQLYSIAIASFIIPSLGVSILSLVQLKNILKKKSFIDENIFFIIFISVGLMIPMFFIQSVAVFVIMQFLWITWIILFLPTASVVSTLLGKPNIGKVVSVFLVLITLSVVEMAPIYKVYSSEPVSVSKDLMTFLMESNEIIDHKSAILVLKSERKEAYNKLLYTTPLVSALSLRNVYYEPEVLEFAKLDEIRNARLLAVKTLEKMLDECDKREFEALSSKIVASTDVGYMLVLRNYSCLSSIPHIKKIFGKDSYSLYQFQ